jgi:inosine/xanthosine triphosphate pyrophosphatase family protein
MKKLLCVTGNKHKFDIGKQAFSKYAIELEQRVFDLDEIQGEDPELIIRDKARRAFDQVNEPLIVTDDSWSIPALRGFPGPYMKSINYWFTPEDFIRLTKELSDKTIILHQFIAYQDAYETVIFSSDVVGTFLPTALGKEGPSIMKVVSLNGDNGLSIAERYDKGIERDITGTNDAWHQVAKWYTSKNIDKN